MTHEKNNQMVFYLNNKSSVRINRYSKYFSAVNRVKIKKVFP